MKSDYQFVMSEEEIAEETAEIIQQEIERDEREREWAEEAHRQMFRDRDKRIDGGLEEE